MIDPAELRAAIFRSQLATFFLKIEFATVTGPQTILGRETVLDEVEFEVVITPVGTGSALPLRICADRVLSAEPVSGPLPVDAWLDEVGFGPGKAA